MREEDEKRVMDATGLLRAWSEGDQAALNELVPLVERELHQLARAYMGRERHDHTLQATALVNEVFLRLARGATPEWKDRAHFVGIAARLMRQVLVDHARTRNAIKRGDGVAPITFDEMRVDNDRPEAMIALDEALSALEQVDERKARVIELVYFAGMTQREIADVLDVHSNTVYSDQRLAEAWIHRYLREDA